MIKRVLCCILSVSILMSIGCVSSYADTTLTDDLSFKYKLLQALNILPENEHGDYGILRDLSKKAFLAFVCNIYGDYNFTEKEADTDKAVAMAEEMGIIHKNQDDLYKPINYNEAMTILVRFLSYEVHAQQNGGFPYGYTRIARSIGLTDGISASAEKNLKEHDVIQLLYNAINAPYAQALYFTDEGAVYDNHSDKNALYELRGIYRVDGIVEATGTARLRNDEASDEGKVVIDGYSYLADEDFSDILGMNVIAYVKEDKAGDDTLLLAFPYNNDETVIYSEYIVGPTSDFTAVEYYDQNDKLKKVNIGNMATVIYNGQPLGTYTEEAFLPKDGSIRFVNNDKSAGYDVVFITSFETIVVERVSKLNESISNIYTYDADNISLSLEEKELDIIKLTDANGEVRIGNINAGDVIKVAKSDVDGRRVVKGYVSRNRISGNVSTVHNGDDITLTIDGIQYVLSKTYEEALANKDAKALEIKTGNSYTFYLDCDGKIAYAEEADNVIKYAILFATAAKGVFAQTCVVRIYTEDGEWKDLVLAEKLSYNGERKTAESIIDQLVCSKDGKLSVIGYKTNSDGKVSLIDTPKIFSDLDDASKNASRDEFNGIENITDNYRPNNSSFDSEIFIADNAVMWFVNSEKMGDVDSYTLGGKSLLQNDESCSFNAYSIDEGMLSDLLVVMRTTSSAASSIQQAELFVVEDVMQTVNSEGEVVSSISGKMGAYEQFSYYCEDSIAEGLQKGDVISVHTDSKGVVDRVSKYFIYGDSSDENMYSYPSVMHAAETIIKGKVMENNITDKWIKIDCNGEKSRIVRTANVSSVIIYDTLRDELYIGSLNDIEKDAVIVTKLKWSRATALVVYQ